MSGVLDAVTSFFATDVVAVYNEDEDQLFAEAIPMKASVNRSAKLFEHPLETSVVVTDHKVRNPDLITLNLVIPNGRYRDVYQEINQVFDRADSLTVQTKANNYDKMVIQAMPHEENPEKFDAIELSLQLKETLFARLTVVELPAPEVADETQQSNQDRGEQNPTEPKQSVAAQALDGVKDFFSGLFQ